MKRILGDIISLAPSLHISEGWEKKPSENKLMVLAEVSVKDEVVRFWEHLDLANDKSMTLERYLDELLGSYYLTRKVIKELPKKEQDVWRPIMNIIYETITLMFSDAVKRKVYLNIEFKSKWDNGERYFPWTVPVENNEKKRLENSTYEEYDDKHAEQGLNAYAKEFKKKLFHCNKDVVMADLQALIKGQKGKFIAKVLLAYEKKGYLTKEYAITDMLKAFESDANADSIRKYYSGKRLTYDDLEDIENMASRIK